MTVLTNVRAFARSVLDGMIFDATPYEVNVGDVSVETGLSDTSILQTFSELGIGSEKFESIEELTALCKACLQEDGKRNALLDKHLN